ncbi:MAG: Nif3-like dinuclear metal center hexameric protein [Vicingus serpentipes]|nr:Nif3-like dinuclear metal center hexameric protein [Vicingus serpentipes]
MKIKEITSVIEEFAPLAYQEGYDNAGLIVGSPENEVKGVLICLDSTEAVVDEAISKDCNLIIAHHPIVFSGLKKLNGKNYIERTVIKAIKNDIAIYAAHTNIDNVANGVSFKMAQKIGLINCKVIAPKVNLLNKVVTFCPEKEADKVRQAMFDAGAGSIGEYGECSFNTEGKGTFKAGENSTPFVGKKNERHLEAEVKIETIVVTHQVDQVVQALIQAHPYEEVAYDIYPLNNPINTIGSGLIGELPKEENEMDFLKRLKSDLKTDGIRYTSLRNKKIKKVALCGGSGSFLLNDAMKANADIFITGDFKYHQFFDAEDKIIIADVGHYESEQFTSELFYELLTEKITNFAVRLSEINTNPINYL